MSDDDLFGTNRDEFFGSGDEFDDFGDFDGGEFDEFGDLGEIDLGDEDLDSPDFGAAEDGGERRTIFGLNRTFVIIGGIVAVILCVAIGGLALLLLNQGPTDVDLTVTSVLTTNTAVAVALEMTETQNAEFGFETATAEAFTDTPTPEPTDTPTPEPSATPITPTSAFVFVTPTPEDGLEDGQGGGVSADAVAMTATALAGILGATPTPEEGVGPVEGDDGATAVAGGFNTPTPAVSDPGTTTGTLPDTGLFDDIGTEGGVNGLLTAGLAVFGLAAVIVVARWLRTR